VPGIFTSRTQSRANDLLSEWTIGYRGDDSVGQAIGIAGLNEEPVDSVFNYLRKASNTAGYNHLAAGHRF